MYIAEENCVDKSSNTLSWTNSKYDGSESNSDIVAVIEYIGAQSLEIIDENAELNDVSSNCSNDCSSVSSLGEEFYDQLEVLHKKFNLDTKRLVAKFQLRHDCITRLKNTSICDVSNPVSPFVLSEVEKTRKNLESSEKRNESVNEDISKDGNDEQLMSNNNNAYSENNSCTLLLDKESSQHDIVDMKKQSIVQDSENNASGEVQIGKNIDIHNCNDDVGFSISLKSANKRLKQLKSTIKAKEEFVSDLIKNRKRVVETKEKFKCQIETLNEQLHQMLEESESLRRKLMAIGDKDPAAKIYYGRKLQHLLDKIKSTNKKVSSLKKIIAISRQTDSKIDDTKLNILEYKKQQEELEKTIKQEMKKLQQFDVQLGKARSQKSYSYNWFTDDFEDLERNSPQDKLKFKSSEVAAGPVSEKYLNQSEDLESALRIEIDYLRNTKENLIKQKKRLEKIINHKKAMESEENNLQDDDLEMVSEHHLVQFEEAVDAVDAIIEHKNEKICGHAMAVQLEFHDFIDIGLAERIGNLRNDELKILLFKYFNKVVDLRLEFKKHDEAFRDLENRYDDQIRYVKDMKLAYQQASWEMESRTVALQRDYEEKISTLLSQISDDSFDSSFVINLRKQLFYYKRLCYDLKSQLEHSKRGVRDSRLLAANAGGAGSVSCASDVDNACFSTYPNEANYSFSQPNFMSSKSSANRRVDRRHAYIDLKSNTRNPSARVEITRERHKLVIQEKNQNQNL